MTKDNDRDKLIKENKDLQKQLEGLQKLLNKQKEVTAVAREEVETQQREAGTTTTTSQ